MKIKLHTDAIKSFKPVKKEINGTTIYETESEINEGILADIYSEDGKVPTRHLTATDSADTTDFSNEVGIIFENVDGIEIDSLEIES